MGAVVALLAGASGAQAAAAGDAAKGAEVFRDTCSICHNAAAGAGVKVGPNLFGVVGRKSATSPGFIYSAAMQKANLTWDVATLRTYLAAPAKMIPGTTMGFAGFTEAADEANLIAYLGTLK